ncbi:MAG TPA: alginate lyase family protein [Candidatus Alistipes cottocaccae]|nr:alginate lyase family protein [Candidatus Alistipes cottocaccae]
MKKIVLTLIATIPALMSAVSCTDYLEPGEIDLTIETPPFEYPETYTFTHPCALVTESDLNRIRTSIETASTTDPVYVSWQQLCANRLAQSTYQANPVETLVRGDATGTGVDKENYTETADPDAAAAFQLALRYRISGDTSYADAAVKVLNDWADVCKRITANDNNQYLLAGFQGYQFANAAELLRDYSGWAAADQADFKQWLLNVWYAKNKWFIENHGGSGVCNLHYWSNWELANLASILAIGIYTENIEMINLVYRNFREGEGSGCINNMIPYDPVPDQADGTNEAIPGNMVAQNMESGRDQGHATLVVAVCAELCQMAENIGLDFWGMEDNKILAMCEYTAKYNCRPEGSFICTTMPFTTYEYCPEGCGCSDHSHGKTHTQVSPGEQGNENRGTIRPCWDLVYAHYAKVEGLGENRVHYSKLFAEQLRYTNGTLTGDGGAGDDRYGSNSSAFDQIGWGTLLFYRGE